jgi:hypothetical protein
MAMFSFVLSRLPSLVTVGWIMIVLIFLMLLFVSLICSFGYADLRINELEKTMTVITETLAKSVESQNLATAILQLLQNKVNSLSSIHQPYGSPSAHLAQLPLPPHEEPSDGDEQQQLMAEIRELLAPVRRLTTQHKQFVEHMVQIQQLRGTLKELTRNVVDLRILLGSGTDDNQVCQRYPRTSPRD